MSLCTLCFININVYAMRHTILNKNNSKNINLLIFYFIIIEFGFVSSTDLGGGGF